MYMKIYYTLRIKIDKTNIPTHITLSSLQYFKAGFGTSEILDMILWN